MCDVQQDDYVGCGFEKYSILMNKLPDQPVTYLIAYRIPSKLIKKVVLCVFR